MLRSLIASLQHLGVAGEHSQRHEAHERRSSVTMPKRLAFLGSRVVSLYLLACIWILEETARMHVRRAYCEIARMHVRRAPIGVFVVKGGNQLVPRLARHTM